VILRLDFKYGSPCAQASKIAKVAKFVDTFKPVNSNLMIADQAAINAGFDFRR